MELELIDFLIEKMNKIYFYEHYPKTEEEYIQQKRVLFEKIKTAKKEYHLKPNETNKSKLNNLKARIKNVVSPLEYEASKKAIEEYKKAYIKEIPEEYWCRDGLIELRVAEYNRLNGIKD